MFSLTGIFCPFSLFPLVFLCRGYPAKCGWMTDGTLDLEKIFHLVASVWKTFPRYEMCCNCTHKQPKCGCMTDRVLGLEEIFQRSCALSSPTGPFLEVPQAVKINVKSSENVPFSCLIIAVWKTFPRYEKCCNCTHKQPKCGCMTNGTLGPEEIFQRFCAFSSPTGHFLEVPQAVKINVKSSENVPFSCSGGCYVWKRGQVFFLGVKAIWKRFWKTWEVYYWEFNVAKKYFPWQHDFFACFHGNHQI